MNKKHFHYSVIDYRHDPTEPKGAILLGMAIEFTTEKSWVVGLGMRATIEPELLSNMGPLTKELLQNPAELFGDEIYSALNGARTPGDVLRHLASENLWSLHVGSPKEMELHEHEMDRDPSVDNLVDEFLFSVWRTQLEAEGPTPDCMPKTGGPIERVFAPMMAEDPRWSEEMPPVWMMPAKVFQAPKFGRR